MADAGTRYTDAACREMERRFRAVYREAQADITEKLDAYIKRLNRRDKLMRAQVAAGTMTQDAYDTWLRGQVFAGKQWKDKLSSVATSLLYANQQANDIVEGKKRAVFGENATYQAYKLENDLGMDLSFGIYDSAAVTNLIKEQPELLPRRKVDANKDRGWNQTKIANCITQGIIQGESIQKIADRIARDTASSNEKAMVRYARTAMTGAQNAGRMEMLHEAQGMGIKVKKKWLATLDSRTRDAHANLDGQTAEVDEPFKSDLGPIMYPGDFSAHPANVWNCFVGETKIASDSEIVKSYKHDYSGRLFTIETSRGVKFTCTPNHPILTPHGWIGAYALNKGDNIVIASGRKFKLLGVYPNVNHIFPRIDAFHELFKKMTGEWASGLSVDFHGDKATANVEIVSKKRLLRRNRDTGTGKSLDKFSFKHAASFVLAKRHFMARFRGIYVTFLSFMRRFGKKLSFIGGKLCHSIIHRFGTVARCNSSVLEPENNSVSCNMKLLRQRLDRFPGKITVDNIVNIKISTASHIPVYNLQTNNEYYFVNSIISYNGIKCNDNFAIVHNCRCTMIYEYPEYMPQNAQRGAYKEYEDDNGEKRREYETIPDMTYKQWKAWKSGGRQLFEQNEQKQEKQFIASKTIEEAIEKAENAGVKYARFDGMTIERANNLVEAIVTLPEDCRPVFVTGTGKDVSTVTGRPMGRKTDQWYGVTYDYRGFGLRTMQLGYRESDYDGGIVVGINTTKYKTLNDLTDAKVKEQAKYKAKTGREWFFNTDGKATAFHEMGHCYYNVRSEKSIWEISGKKKTWEDLSARWAEESLCDMLKNPEEAFAEAWAAYYSNGRELPGYISEFIRGLE